MTPGELSQGVQWVLLGILVLLSLAMCLAFVRVARGPSASDRIVALDLAGTISVGIIAVYAALTQQPLLLRVAMGLALVAFLGTVTVMRYLERRASLRGAPAAQDQRREGATR